MMTMMTRLQHLPDNSHDMIIYRDAKHFCPSRSMSTLLCSCNCKSATVKPIDGLTRQYKVTSRQRNPMPTYQCSNYMTLWCIGNTVKTSKNKTQNKKSVTLNAMFHITQCLSIETVTKQWIIKCHWQWQLTRRCTNRLTEFTVKCPWHASSKPSVR